MDELELSRLQFRQRHFLWLAGLLLGSITAVFLIFAIAISSPRTPPTIHPKITMQAAENVALAKEPGKLLSRELENENGRLVYSFDINHAGVVHEVSVDAEAGTMVEDIVEDRSNELNERR
jgi:Peptidase propeptide and YPEB domain